MSFLTPETDQKSLHSHPHPHPQTHFHSHSKKLHKHDHVATPLSPFRAFANCLLFSSTDLSNALVSEQHVFHSSGNVIDTKKIVDTRKIVETSEIVGTRKINDTSKIGTTALSKTARSTYLTTSGTISTRGLPRCENTDRFSADTNTKST